MEIAMTIAGWVVWALALVVGLGSLASRPSDPGVRSMMRIQGAVILVGCLVTVLFPISNFWMIAVLPVAFFLPMFLARRRIKRMEVRFEQLLRERERTGVPLDELLKQEVDRFEEK